MNVTMDKIVGLCKRRGFLFQGSELYGGLQGTWDYGPMGVELKNNVKRAWWRANVYERDDMEGLDRKLNSLEIRDDPLVEQRVPIKDLLCDVDTGHMSGLERLRDGKARAARVGATTRIEHAQIRPPRARPLHDRAQASNRDLRRDGFHREICTSQPACQRRAPRMTRSGPYLYSEA